MKHELTHEELTQLQDRLAELLASGEIEFFELLEKTWQSDRDLLSYLQKKGLLD